MRQRRHYQGLRVERAWALEPDRLQQGSRLCHSLAGTMAASLASLRKFTFLFSKSVASPLGVSPGLMYW